jgi:hypothetical protein
MRTLEEMLAACKRILISGEMFDGEDFEDELAVIFPDWTEEEEDAYHDAMVEYFFDRDYWMVVYHDEEIIGSESESMECVVKSYKEVV